MIKLYAKYLKPYWIMVIGIVVFVFIQSMADLYLPTLTASIINDGVAKQNIDFVWSEGLKMLGVTFISMTALIIASFLSSRVAAGFGRDVRGKLFRHVEQFSLHEFDELSTASLITRNTNDVMQIQNVTVMIFRMVLGAPIMAVGGIIMAMQTSIDLSWIFLASIPLLLILILVVGGSAVPLFKTMQKKLDHLNLVLRERLIGIRVIRAYDKEAFEEERFNDANKDLTKTAIKVNRLMAIMMPVMMVILNFTSIAIMWFGAHNVADGMMAPGDIFAFIQYAMQIMMAFVMMSVIFIMMPRASASAARINEVFNVDPEIGDNSHVLQTPSDVKGMVEFRNVTFHYPGAEEPALSNISFTSKAGETTAIIGGTGAGKSTLVNLIPRFYDISDGEILIDGVNITDLAQEDLRSKIGYVPQKSVLFAGTIAHNIRYGKEDASLDEIRHATDIAQATDFIERKEEKFDFMIAQGGTNVSGGQKQRLAIARALVRKPEVYIFDDSFSALDFKTDAKLREALAPETKDSTVILVGQRVSSVMHADRIIVLDDGKVADMGTHEELLLHSAVYKEIVLSQLSEEELA